MNENHTIHTSTHHTEKPLIADRTFSLSPIRGFSSGLITCRLNYDPDLADQPILLYILPVQQS